MASQSSTTSSVAPRSLFATRGGEDDDSDMTALPAAASSRRESSNRRSSTNTRRSVDASSSSTTTLVSKLYPTTVPVPSRALVQQLFELACTDKGSDQGQLANAGLLSLSSVVLPAVAACEDQALKGLQAKLQRDAPDSVDTAVACRKAVYDAVAAAMQAAQASAEKRQAALQAQRAQEQARLEAERRAAVAQNEHYRASQRRQRLRAAQKSHPRNQDLWRQVAFLMTELSQLQRDERLWKNTLQTLESKNKSVQVHAMDTENLPPPGDNAALKEVQSLVQGVEESLAGMELSTVRMQQALELIQGQAQGLLVESQHVQKQLYQTYKQDFLFHGYRGIQDPKGLLQALSQSQTQTDVDDDNNSNVAAFSSQISSVM